MSAPEQFGGMMNAAMARGALLCSVAAFGLGLPGDPRTFGVEVTYRFR